MAHIFFTHFTHVECRTRVALLLKCFVYTLRLHCNCIASVLYTVRVHHRGERSPDPHAMVEPSTTAVPMDSRTSKSKEQERHGAKGLLDDRTPAQLLIQGIDVSDGSKYTCKDLFGDLTGASLMDAIWEKFGVGEQDVEWFYKTDGGEQARTIMRSPLSRQIQESTCSEYMQRLYREGLSQLASGCLVFNSKTYNIVVCCYVSHCFTTGKPLQ